MARIATLVAFVLLGKVPFDYQDAKGGKKRQWIRARKIYRKILQPDDPDAIRTALQRRLESHRRALTPATLAKTRQSLSIPSAGSPGRAPTPIPSASISAPRKVLAM